MEIVKLLQKKKKQVLESWINNQLADPNLREDLMSNEEMREQSNEFLDMLMKVLNDKNIVQLDS